MTDAIIPARNEARTIGDVVTALKRSEFIDGRIVVCVDPKTTDATSAIAMGAGANCVLDSPHSGKGQCCVYAISRVYNPTLPLKRVMFCDADLTGLTPNHVNELCRPRVGMTIGVPDFPEPDERGRWPLARLEWSWPWVSGERVLPYTLVRKLPLHGYLMETQINQAARALRAKVTFVRLAGVKAPFNMNAERLAAMERDAAWGRQAGIL